MIIHCPQGAARLTQVVRAEHDLRDATRKRGAARVDRLDYIERLDLDVAACRAAVKRERAMLRDHERSCSDCTKTEQRGRRSALPTVSEIASLIADDGLDLDEVAAIYDVSASTVRQHLGRAGYSAVTGLPIDREPAVDVLAELNLAGLAQQGDWADEALCAQTDPEAFFPEKGGSVREAKAVCAQCSVAAECLDWALTNKERFGIFGGLSERERRAPIHHTNPAA